MFRWGTRLSAPPLFCSFCPGLPPGALRPGARFRVPREAATAVIAEGLADWGPVDGAPAQRVAVGEPEEGCLGERLAPFLVAPTDPPGSEGAAQTERM